MAVGVAAARRRRAGAAMIRVRRAAVTPRSAERAFAVISDIESYPRFVRGCRGAEILERDGDELIARLEIVVAGASRRLITRNRSRQGREIDMRLVSGPVRELSGQWRFEPLSSDSCRITLSFRFAPTGVVARLAGQLVADRAADRAFEDFLARLRAAKP